MIDLVVGLVHEDGVIKASVKIANAASGLYSDSVCGNDTHNHDWSD
jgi:hypothetical protein